MSTAPFQRLARSIPVVVVTGPGTALPVEAGAVVVEIEPAGHDHAAGEECLACASRGDVRVMLFELLERSRQGLVSPFSKVIVDARRSPSPQDVVDRLVPGRQPAFGLRDHTVARNFHLI